MDEKFNLLFRVLKELQRAGALDKLILAGSWCQYYFRILFDASPEVPLIRTTDIDFVIPNPHKITKSVDVGGILNDLGFDDDFDYHTGLVKYVHPDLEIQFLTPALGRGKKKPYEIEPFSINAEGLRYLTPLQDFKFRMKHKGISIWLPEPEAYSLQKILISLKRKSDLKREKDLDAAKNIGELCLQSQRRRERMIQIFNSFPLKWRKKILKVSQDLSADLFNHLGAHK